jgi:FixJ family two-component response regulator
MTVERREMTDGARDPLRVLVVDSDDDVTELVGAMLTDEGYDVRVLTTADHDSIAAEVGRLEPDCILLDGTGPVDFGGSWDIAAYLADRSRRVPTIMFTAHSHAVHEARSGTSDRAVAAGFAAILAKPFGLDDLLEAVATASGRSERFDRSEAADRERTAQLVDELSASGAGDIRTSERREWATFVSPYDQLIYQLYWWQRMGLYILGRYDLEARLERVGQFYERSAAVDAAMPSALGAAST